MEPRPRTAPRIRGATAEVQEAARNLRRALTPAERHLWTALRNKHLGGLRFRCQHAVGPFILDFYCPSRKLVVEVDGGTHEEPDQVVRDAARTEQLESYGYRILRFSNQEVLTDLPAVLERILEIRLE